MIRPLIIAIILTGLSFTGSPVRLSAQSLIETVKTGSMKDTKKVLAKKNVNVNETDSEGLTSLMVATIANDSAMVDLLLSKGADPNIKAKNGMTVLHAAAFHARDQIAPLLITAGADPNAVDGKGRSPLLVAAQMGSTNIITILLKAGANIEYPDLKGNTALLLACGGRHLGAMDELLERGANPNARDLQGRTALMLLCVLGEDEMVRILLKYKADISLVDHSMRSALSYAREYRRKACIAVLEQSGAKY